VVLAWVVTPSVLALLIGLAAVQTGRHAAPGRLVRFGTITGAIVLWILVIISAVLTVTGGTPVIIRPDGPGLWAIVGAPAFTALICMTGSRRSPATEGLPE
jgi:amino acid transporter